MSVWRILKRSGCAVLGLLLALPALSIAQPPRRVLVISDFRPEAIQALDVQLRTELTPADGQIDYYSEFLDANSFPQADYQVAYSNLLALKYAQLRIDALVTIGRFALEFAMQHGDSLFRDVPHVALVSAANADRLREWQRVHPATGLVDPLDFRGTLDMMTRLQPDLRTVLLVSGSSARDAVLEASARRQLAEFHSRITVTSSAGAPLEQVRRDVAGLAPGSAILFLSYYQDRAGRRFLPFEVLPSVLTAAAVPVYSGSSRAVELGSVGGRVTDGADAGKELAALVERLLRGDRAQDIPVAELRSTALVAGWKPMERWGLDPSRLPAGTTVVGRELSIWERYRGTLIAATALFLMQAGTIVGLLVYRKRRRESEERSSAILHAVPDLMFIQTRDGVYLDYHASDLSQLFVPPESFLGKKNRDVLPLDLSMLLESAFEKVALTQQPIRVEYSLKIAGDDRRYEARITPYQRDRLLTVVRDVTDQERALVALRNTQEDLARASRLTALGEFAASIAHEVGQPLTAIVANAKACEAWLDGTQPRGADMKTALDEILEAGERAGDIIKRNRELFRHKRVERAPLEINDVIRQALAHARQRIEKADVSLELELGEDLPLVIGDRIELHQVLWNLIGNAIDAMDAMDATDGADVVKHLAIVTKETDGPAVEVLVKDTGIGFDGVDVDRIFTPSYTTKKDGTGFGLSISRSVVEAHGGVIRAARNKGAGTTFSFTIPAETEGR